MEFAFGLLATFAAFAIGWLWGRHSADENHRVSRSSGSDQQRMLQLLEELGAWTDEYSDNVSDYQQQLNRLVAAVRSHNAGAEKNDQVDGRQLMGLLEEIFAKGTELQTRLDSAESELERRARQITSYLQQARTDVMTDLLNRRAFDEMLEIRFAAFRDGGPSFAVALLDVDQFKRINDEHGHLAGDGVLQRLSRWMAQLGEQIQVARFGGDEFAVLAELDACALAGKLDGFRQTIERSRFQVGEIELKVTLSIGVGQCGDDAAPLAIIRRADEAMYRAKELGRNRTFFDEGDGPTALESLKLENHPDHQN